MFPYPTAVNIHSLKNDIIKFLLNQKNFSSKLQNFWSRLVKFDGKQRERKKYNVSNMNKVFSLFQGSDIILKNDVVSLNPSIYPQASAQKNETSSSSPVKTPSCKFLNTKNKYCLYQKQWKMS